MLYGDETWPVKIEDTCRLQRTDRWMCSISLSERRPSEEIRERLGIQDISAVMQQLRLRWFGPIERMETEDWVGKCKSLVVDGAAGRRRPRKTWNQVVQKDSQTMHLEKASLKTVMDGEMPSRSHRPTHACMERTLNEEKYLESVLLLNLTSPSI